MQKDIVTEERKTREGWSRWDMEPRHERGRMVKAKMDVQPRK